ncbi:hypothetical protein [Sphingobacterium psychroaquaticum]|uniref:Uncharacterized protein n=1 Tax=Sphingobacterium psychroaquaticum TaxID=561061 RepID=A0A1X7JVW0_9SPHI|nr:hypothetical protein [Sphingobacterium psychroaquaticum]SMG32504.1 hypothetical protein SAMN05660862_2257 [Sphingobacterium psychroaquaticum]
MNEFLQEHVLPNLWGGGVAVISAVWFWYRSKPKEKIENDGGIVDNAKKVLEMSEDIAERLEKQLLAADEVILQYKEKLRIALENENTCQKALKAMRQEYEKFKNLFEEQRVELEALKDECRLLRITLEKNGKSDIIPNDLRAN